MAGGFPLGTRVDLGLDGWVDVTSFVYARDPISITRGRSADASSTDPASCRFTLDNRDDRFSMRNPRGPYFGKLRRNVPVRVSLPADLAGLDVKYASSIADAVSNAECADTAAFSASATLDVRVDMDADQWASGLMVSKMDTGVSGLDWVLLADDGYLRAFWGNASGSVEVTSTERLPDYLLPGRRAVRMVLTAANADGVAQLDFYTAATIDGPWTSLGSAWTYTESWVIGNGAAPLRVGRNVAFGLESLPGRVARVVVRADGATAADVDFSSQTPGVTSFTDAQGNAWAVGNDAEISDRDVRFYGEVSQWPQSRDVAGVDKTVAVEAYGMRRRLSYNAPSLDSAMVREFASPARANIVAYWPMEDAEGATRMASALPGAAPMAVSGSPQIAGYNDWPSSKPIPYMKTGSFTAAVPRYDTSTGEIALRWFADVDANVTATAGFAQFVQLTTTTMVWSLDLDTQGSVRVQAWSRDRENLLYDSGWYTTTDGPPGVQRWGFLSWNLAVRQNGAKVEMFMNAIDFQGDQVWNQDIPVATQINEDGPTGKVGAAVSVTIGPYKNLGDIAVGHFAVANLWDAYAGTGGALNTWNGETAEHRANRLGREDGYTVRVDTGGRPFEETNAHHLGDQTADTWLALLEEAETADLGLLVEPRGELGFVYRARYALTNQPAKASLDYDTGEIAGEFQPVDDDQSLTNDVTVKRADGGSFRMEDDTSPLSVLPPPLGVGRYAVETEISAQSDEYLPSQAGFRLRAGTIDEARYPTLQVNLHSPRISDAQAARVRRLDIGDRLDILHADAWTRNVPQIVTGYTEELDVVTHTFEFNLTPADPWTAGVVETDRYDTAGSVLDTAVDDGETVPDPLGEVVARWYGDGVANGPMATASAGADDTPFNTVDAASVDTGRVRFDQSGADAQVAWDSSTLGATMHHFAVRCTVELSAYAPDGNGRILNCHNPSNALLSFVSVTSAGILRLHGPSAALALSSTAWPLGVPVTLELVSLDGVTTLTAKANGATWATLTADTGSGTTPLGIVRFGTPASPPPTWPRMWFDGMAVLDPDAATDPNAGVNVRTTVGPLWTTDAAEFPFDVMIGGERMTVTAIGDADASGVQAFTVTRGVNGIQIAHGAGTDVRLADPAYVTL